MKLLIESIDRISLNKVIIQAIEDYVNEYHKTINSPDQMVDILFDYYSDSGFFDYTDDDYDELVDATSDIMEGIDSMPYIYVNGSEKEQITFRDVINMYIEAAEYGETLDFSEWLRESISNGYLKYVD